MTAEPEATRRQRALARQGRLGAVQRLTPSERVALTTELTRISWSLSRKPWPTYTRQTIPVRILDRESR